MKRIIWLPVALLLISVAMLAAGYALLQSPIAAKWLANWLNSHTPYHITIASLDYRLAQPDKLVLHQVRVNMQSAADTPGESPLHLAPLPEAQTKALLNAQQLVITLGLGRITAVSIERGALNLPPDGVPQTINIPPLRFRDLTINQTGSWGSWQLTAANGNISTPLRFQLSARHFTLNNWQANNIQLQGERTAGAINLTHINAQLAGGSLTGSARQQTDGRWLVSDLQLSQIHGQTDRSLAQLADNLRQLFSLSLPEIQLHRFTLRNAQLEGSDWAASDLNIDIRNLTLQQGRWRSEQGDFSLHASDLVLAGEQFIQPEIATELDHDDIILHRFTSQWRKGRIQASGRYQRQQHALTLDSLKLEYPQYPLPPHWRHILQRPLPGWLDSLSVTSLHIQQGLIIDTDPALPFQLTALNGEADQLQLINHRQWGLWRGSLHASAAQATFNGVDLRQPVLDLHADALAISSLLQTRLTSGALSASISLCQCPQRTFTLQLTAKQLADSLLPKWGWPAQLSVSPQPGQSANSVQLLDKIHLQLNGQFHQLQLLPASLNGKLQIISDNNQHTEQEIRNGEMWYNRQHSVTK